MRIQGIPVEKQKKESNNEVKIAVADEGAAPAAANAVNPNEKMGVFKDPLPSHAPVATTPEVSAFPTPVKEILTRPEYLINACPPLKIHLNGS